MGKSWKLFTGLMLLFLLLLSGCHHDLKQAKSIYANLEEAARMEKTFAENQQTLKEVDKEGKAIFDQIMDLDTEHLDQLKQHIEAAEKKNDEQKQLLREMDDALNKAHEFSRSIESAVEKIRNAEQKQLAIEAVELMDKRYDLFESYYKQYVDVLKESNQFYEALQEKEKDTKALDKQIKTMNKHYHEMEKKQDQFNRCTEQYNEIKNKYYQIVGLTKNT